MNIKTLRWGLVGYGDLAEKRLAAALRDAQGSELVGIWGRDPARTSDFARRHGIEAAHTSLGGLLQSEVDAVYVCTPPDSHAEYALAALEAGKHVLVEKPMAANVDQCREMVLRAQTKGLTLAVAYYRRAYPKMQRVKKLIDNGALGTVTFVNITAHSWFAPALDDPKLWRVEKSRSGGAGALADIGVHRLDLLDYWLGPSTVLHADMQHLIHSYEVEDGATILLRLSNGAPVHAYFAWNSHTFGDRFEIVGTEGKIILDPLDGDSLVVIRGRERMDEVIEPPANPQLPLIEDFVNAVHENRSPLCDGAAGLRTSELLSKILD